MLFRQIIRILLRKEKRVRILVHIHIRILTLISKFKLILHYR